MRQFSYRVKDLRLPRLRLVNNRTMARDFQHYQVLIHECGIFFWTSIKGLQELHVHSL